MKYINSGDLAAPLQTILSDQGTVQAFTFSSSTSGGNVSNVVIISDVQENIAPICMIERLDIPIANVNIAVKFIESGVDTARGSE